MKITEDDITYIENFVKTELELRTLERCAQLGTVLEGNEKEFLFGMYASSIGEFKFLQGESYQILSIVEALQMMYAEKGMDKFAEHFEPPIDFKMDKHETNVFSFGWFYGSKPRKRVHISVLGAQEIQTQLLPKLTQFFHSFKMKPIQPITKDIITIV